IQVVRTTDRVVPVEVVERVVDVAEVPRRHGVGQVVHGKRNTGTVVDPVTHRGVGAPGGGQVRFDFRQVVLVPVRVREVLIRGVLAQASSDARRVGRGGGR